MLGIPYSYHCIVLQCTLYNIYCISIYIVHYIVSSRVITCYRYKELVVRPSVKMELIAERETLLAQLLTYMKSLKEEFTKRTSGMFSVLHLFLYLYVRYHKT